MFILNFLNETSPHKHSSELSCECRSTILPGKSLPVLYTHTIHGTISTHVHTDRYRNTTATSYTVQRRKRREAEDL